KLKDLGDNFSQRLVCPLESYELKSGYVVYEYSLKSQASYSVDKTLEGGIRNLDYIPITQSISWEYDKAPHALVTGQTGKGKTYLLFWFIRELYSSGAVLKIIDAKMSDLFYMKRFLGDENVVSKKGQIMKLLRESKEYMEERYQNMLNRDDYKMGENYR